MTTRVPPDSGPWPGARPAIDGTGEYVNVPKETAMPFAVVTLTFTAPTPAGDVTVIWVGESTVYVAADVVPKLTSAAPVGPGPVMTRPLPPSSGPDTGVGPAIHGAAVE